MKRITKRIISALSVCAMFTVSLPMSGNAANESVQPRGSYHVYGDVDNDGKITAYDCSCTLSASGVFEDLTGSKNLPLEYEVARPAVYFKNLTNPVPQAADTNGDGIINDVDAQDILNYYACLSTNTMSDYKGRCGTIFYVS